jgi:hypothetical protein
VSHNTCSRGSSQQPTISQKLFFDQSRRYLQITNIDSLPQHFRHHRVSTFNKKALITYLRWSSPLASPTICPTSLPTKAAKNFHFTTLLLAEAFSISQQNPINKNLLWYLRFIFCCVKVIYFNLWCDQSSWIKWLIFPRHLLEREYQCRSTEADRNYQTCLHLYVQLTSPIQNGYWRSNSHFLCMGQ